jgi:hypothetical protein
VRIAVKVLGIVDEEVLEYHWGPDWLVWDAECTTQQYAQHVEYTLRPDHTGNSTVVTVDITVEPDSLIPDFLIKRAGKDADRCGNRGAAQSSTARQVIAPKSTFCRKSARHCQVVSATLVFRGNSVEMLSAVRLGGQGLCACPCHCVGRGRRGCGVKGGP